MEVKKKKLKPPKPPPPPKARTLTDIQPPIMRYITVIITAIIFGTIMIYLLFWLGLIFTAIIGSFVVGYYIKFLVLKCNKFKSDLLKQCKKVQEMWKKIKSATFSKWHEYKKS